MEAIRRVRGTLAVRSKADELDEIWHIKAREERP